MHFDEAHLVKELENRPVWARLAFAAASASRLFPSYKKFCEETKLSNPDELSECLNAGWLYAVTPDNKSCKSVSLVERSLKLYSR